MAKKFGNLLRKKLVPLIDVLAGFAIAGIVSMRGAVASLGVVVGFVTASFINKFCLKKGKKLRLIKRYKRK